MAVTNLKASVFSFYLLTSHAFSDKGHHISLHAFSPVVSLHILIHFGASCVNGKLGSMSLRHQYLLEVGTIGNGKSTFVVNEALMIGAPPV